MKTKLTIFLNLFLLSQCSSRKLPSTFKKCNLKSENFNECLRKAVEDAISQLDKPLEETNLPSLEPLMVPEVTIPAGPEIVAFQQNYKNFTVSGLTKLNVTRFVFDFEKQLVDLECYFPEIKHDFEYNFRGELLKVPFFGRGPGTIIEDNVKYNLIFHLEKYKINNVDHFKVVDCQFTLLPKVIKFNFQNLLDGNEVEGDKINKLFNDNYMKIFMEVRKDYEKFFAKVYADLFDKLLKKVSISELFDSD